MRYISCPSLSIEREQIPELKQGQVLIEVAASGINRADIFQKQGQYKPPIGASHILGLEVSGVIKASCADHSPLKVGDQVCALLAGGGYADHVVVDACCVLPIPSSMDLVHAAGIMETCATVWFNLIDKAHVHSGETILIHGGTSGLGTMAIQLAKAWGAYVYATCGEDEKCAFARSLGADVAINYQRHNFAELITEGVDVILDIVGAPYFEKHMKILHTQGRLVCIALLGGKDAQLNMARLLLKNITLMGSTLRHRTAQQKYLILTQLCSHVWPLFEENAIKPIIEGVFSVSEVANAHALMESGKHKGKIILQW